MGKSCSPFTAIVIAATLFTGIALTGCAHNVAVGYRVYDPYYGDYHVWNDPEIGYYNQWIVETHRPHREFRRLPRRDQRAYWTWRHSHGDHH